MMFIALALHSHHLCFKYQKITQGGNHLNPKFNASLKAKSTGIKMGLYIEFQAPEQLNLVMSFFLFFASLVNFDFVKVIDNLGIGVG